MTAKRQTLEVMEHYAAKHAGLVLARYAPCSSCGARLDMTAVGGHKPSCRYWTPPSADNVP